MSFNEGSTHPESYSHLPDIDECAAIDGAGNSMHFCSTSFASLHSGNMRNVVTC
ncbi:MAG: hypothetical protein GTO62_02065, partial [Planctomycetales bacterium]|nr:hypothetical protein [Planctomycetales bacterium]NIP68016.1 hypothetical protein [Planctomycetales bacterium]